jgi:hypothetical protein
VKKGYCVFTAEDADGKDPSHGVTMAIGNTIFLKQTAYSRALEHIVEAMKVRG